MQSNFDFLTSTSDILIVLYKNLKISESYHTDPLAMASILSMCLETMVESLLCKIGKDLSTDLYSKTELLFLALILNMLKNGGEAGVIIPDGVLFGTSKAHMQIRKQLTEHNTLLAVVSLPSGVFKPYAGVSTAILFFKKGGKTKDVLFFNLLNDGFSLDDKRQPIKLNDIPNLITAWDQHFNQNKDLSDPKQQAFTINISEIIENKYDLSITKYKQQTYTQPTYTPPTDILKNIETLQKSSTALLKEIKTMLGGK